MFNPHLLDKLPLEIIINHILPYTYRPQSKELMQDIRSYYVDNSFLENAYTFDINENILMNDISKFCSGRNDYLYFNENNKLPPKLEHILRRNYTMSKFTNYELYNFVTQVLYVHNPIANVNKIKLLFALLNPIERTRFINKFVIDPLVYFTEN
jgi:hypothetical protein